MSEIQVQGSGRVLDPLQRTSEVLFGLIMAVTFTGSLHVSGTGSEEIRTMFFAALGCNLAWGIVDAVMFVISDLVERNRSLLLLRSVHAATRPEEGRELVASTLPPGLALALSPEETDTLYRRALALKAPYQHAPITAHTLRGAIGVFLLVTLSTFPLVLPFALSSDPVRALRWSHGIALGMLFLLGRKLGGYAGLRPLVTGFGMIGIGIVLALLTIALGG
jgi:VIT1/CCC1 family predicted Fe2+/Mn2+ transporter